MTDKRKPGPKVEGLPDGDPTPALYHHCANAYAALLADAQSRTDDQGNEIIVWEGYSTAFFTGQLHLSVPYYTRVTRALIRMGCIRQLKRGGGTAQSMWELITEPTKDLYESKMPRKRTKVDRVGMIQDQLSSLNQRVSALERALERVISE